MRRIPTHFFSGSVLFVWILIILGILAALELGARFLYPPEKCGDLNGCPQGFNLPDPDYGYIPRPNVFVPATKLGLDGKLIYSVNYSTDEFSRRITPLNNQPGADRFLIFFGCSFTFGEGLQDNQTLPYHAGVFAPCYVPYNYGYSGYGPQQMLLRLQDPDFSKQIKQDRGIMIYGPAHVARAIGTYYASTNWAKDFPFYYLDNENNLVRDGNFQTGRPVRSTVYSAISHVRLLDIFFRRYGLPRKFSEKDIELTARIIEESFKLFEIKFPNSRSYFMLLPGVDDSDQAVAALLRKAGISILDFSSRQEFHGKGFIITNDGHPTELWNQRLAELIVEKLKISGENCNEN